MFRRKLPIISSSTLQALYEKVDRRQAPMIKPANDETHSLYAKGEGDSSGFFGKWEPTLDFDNPPREFKALETPNVS